MPIYAYRCATCGHAKDVLQKISDPMLSVCPACGAETFVKQVTAAGFQLKGSGWYVTDFRGDGKGGKPAAESGADAVKGDGDKAEGKKGDTPGAESADKPKAESTKSEPASPAPAPAPTPAAAPPAGSKGASGASGGQ